MKTILCSLILAVGILLSASTTDLQAQGCTWTFTSSIDCQISYELYLTCPPNPPVPVSAIHVSKVGCWTLSSSTPFPVFQCNPPIGCNYSVKLNGVFYANGSIICCNPGATPEDCVKCACAYVNIDPINRTISLDMACSGEIGGVKWDCCDDY